MSGFSARREPGGDDESSPLLQRTGAITNKESVYTYMVLIPPLTRRMHGHYCTTSVALAFSLFCLAILLQMSLTFLAGQHVFESREAWKSGLVQELFTAHDWKNLRNIKEVMHTIKSAKEVIPSATDSFDGTKEYFLGESEKGEPGKKAKAVCCAGPSCFGYGLPCCPPKSLQVGVEGENATAAKDHQIEGKDPVEQLEFLSSMLRKPGGGGGHGGGAHGDTHQVADGEDDHHQSAIERAWRPSSVCYSWEQTLDCAQPSSRVLNLFDKLDTNGDGIWTMEEARADDANIGCRAGVSMEDIFQSACRGIQRDVTDSKENGKNAPKVPAQVRARKELSFAYFEYWQGLAAICIHTDVSMCSTLISKGIFNGAMDPKNRGARGGAIDLDSTMSYCQRLLSAGGVCDAALPGAYVLYRSRIEEKCGAPFYSSGPRYINPHDTHDVLSTTAVSYEHLSTVELTHSPQFLFFLFLVIVLWYINLVDELRDVIDLWDFLFNFPVDNNVPFMTEGMRERLSSVKGRLVSMRDKVKGAAHSVQQAASGAMDRIRRRQEQAEAQGHVEEAAQAAEDLKDLETVAAGVADIEGAAVTVDTNANDEVEEYKQLTPRTALLGITSIARPHQLVCIGIACVRSTVLVYLAIAGTEFMLMNRSYIDLLLNSLAVAFIFDLDEFLYQFLVPDETKEILDLDACKMEFRSSLPAKGFGKLLFERHFWGLFVIPGIAFMYVLQHDWYDTSPVLEALECACLHQGSRCNKAVPSDVEWWDNYWAHSAKLTE